MPFLLEDLVIDRVDLVDEGANSAAFISFYKRKERSDTMELQEIIGKLEPAHADVVKATLEALTGDVTKATETIKALTAERDEATQKLATAEDDLKTANDDLANAKEELGSLEANKAAFDEEETIKGLPDNVRKFVETMKAQKEAADEVVRKAMENEKQATAVAKAAELKSLPVEQEKLVAIIKGASPELLEVLTSINKAVEESVLNVVGKSNPGSNSTSNEAWGKIEAKAKEIAKTDGISKAKAISKAVNDNPELYKQYLEGGAN